MQLNGISQINTFIKHNTMIQAGPSSLFSVYTASFEHIPVTSITNFVYAEQLRQSQFTKQKSYISMGRLFLATIAINLSISTARVRICCRCLSTAAAVSDRSGGMKYCSLLWLKMM